MSADERVLAEMDCFHSYYRFCRADGLESADQTRYEAWLDYKQAILRREQLRCRRCGQVRPPDELDVKPIQSRVGPEQLAPDNLACVCLFCDETTGAMLRPRRSGRPA